MQPRPAAARARARSCDWLPPQPCTNSTPGMAVAGASRVPAMRSPSTAISSASSRVSTVFHYAILRDQADMIVDRAELYARVGRRLAGTVHLEGRRAHLVQRWPRLQG